MFKVYFYNASTFEKWTETYPSYTAAYIAWKVAQELNDPKRQASTFEPQGTFYARKQVAHA